MGQKSITSCLIVTVKDSHRNMKKRELNVRVHNGTSLSPKVYLGLVQQKQASFHAGIRFYPMIHFFCVLDARVSEVANTEKPGASRPLYSDIVLALLLLRAISNSSLVPPCGG